MTLGPPFQAEGYEGLAHLAGAGDVGRDLLIETLRVQITRMRRMKSGASSEKLDHAIAQLKLALEELEAEVGTFVKNKPAPAKMERLAPIAAASPVG